MDDYSKNTEVIFQYLDQLLGNSSLSFDKIITGVTKNNAFQICSLMSGFFFIVVLLSFPEIS